MNDRLWVTGLGMVTSLGVGVEPTWSGLVRGDRAIRPVTLFDTHGYRTALAGEVEGVVVPPGGWSRTSTMAATAAEEAMRAASVDVRRARVGLVVGGTTGGMLETERILARLHAEPGLREVFVDLLPHPLTATGDRLDERLGPFARVRTLSSACSSGANAIVVAAVWLLTGGVDVAVAGGSDALCRLTLSGFGALGALDPDRCRPFDRGRRGTSLGEGAGFLVLEKARSARARGAAPIAELAGWALGSEAHHITNPDPGGKVVTALVRKALARAGVTPSEVDYVNAHGTGTSLNDAMEAAALHHALGEEMHRIPVSSSKGQIGHTLGAAGAIEAAITALVVSRRTLVPTGGLVDPDAELGLVHVPGSGRAAGPVRVALSNAFGFGGMDTVLVLTEPRDAMRSGVASSPRAVVTGAAVFGPCGLLDAEECAALPARSHPSRSAPDPDVRLDAMRARRLDRGARLAAVAVQQVVAGLDPSAAADTGVVLGSAFDDVDGCAAFMHRVFEKGPSSASPAQFPNLVPSSAVGGSSIYLGLRGPAFATADLATSGESAFAQAVQLVEAGEAERIVAGGVESRSDLVERVLAALYAASVEQANAERSDLAAVVLVESEQAARKRGARVLARVRQMIEWRSDPEPAAHLIGPAGPVADVVLARPSAAADSLLAGTAWARAPRLVCLPALGESDGLGAAAVAVAASRIAAGRASDVLVLGLAPGRGYAVVFASP